MSVNPNKTPEVNITVVPGMLTSALPVLLSTGVAAGVSVLHVSATGVKLNGSSCCTALVTLLASV